MKRRILILASACLLTLGSLGAFYVFDANKSQARTNTNNSERPFAALNQKARAARSREVNAVRELVNEVFSVTMAEAYLAGMTSSTMKDRLTRAEVRYRQGQSSGIPEVKVVRAVNKLADRLNLPQFARTNLYEVGKLRLHLFPAFSQLISHGGNPQSSLTAPEMSPIEAFFVTAMLLQQKTINEEFQITHSERLARWSEIQNRRQESVRRAVLRQMTEGRSSQLQAALQQGFSALSATELVQTPKKTLDDLGVEE